MNVFNSIKQINRLRKEINRLLSKGISSIYLKVTIKTLSKLQPGSHLQNLNMEYNMGFFSNFVKI